MSELTKRILKINGFFNLILLIVIFPIGVHTILGYLSFNTDTAPVNTFCANKREKTYCNISEDETSKKFIFFGLDGVSWLFLKRMKESIKDHSKEFIGIIYMCICMLY